MKCTRIVLSKDHCCVFYLPGREVLKLQDYTSAAGSGECSGSRVWMVTLLGGEAVYNDYWLVRNSLADETV